MTFSHSFPSMTFALLIVGQFVESGVGPIGNIVGIATCFKEWEHFIRFVGKIRVITVQTSKSKKLRIRNGVFHV